MFNLKFRTKVNHFNFNPVFKFSTIFATLIQIGELKVYNE